MTKRIKRIINCFEYFGLSAFIIIKYIIIQKIHRKRNVKKIIKIKCKKTGNSPFYIRPYTTDLNVLKNILFKDGEYDFIYDKEYLPIIKKAKVVIDAGANIGVFSRMVLEINNNMNVIAIEPENNNFDILMKNMSNYNANLIKKGLFNEKCNLKINESPSGEWGFTVSKTKKGESFDVEATSVNDLMNEYKINKIDIIKMDIEGSEYYIFDDSANSWLKKTKVIIIEMHDRKIPGCTNKVMSKMKELGFNYKVYNENYVFYK